VSARGDLAGKLLFKVVKKRRDVCHLKKSRKSFILYQVFFSRRKTWGVDKEQAFSSEADARMECKLERQTTKSLS
jgi:hypothetical protein